MSIIRENFESFVKNWLSFNRHRKLIALYESETEKLLNKKSVAKSSDNGPENQQKNFFGMEYILAFSLYMQVSTSYDKKNSSISIDEYEHLKDSLKVSDIFAKKNQSYPFYIKRTEFIKKVLMLIEAVDMDQKFYSLLPKLNVPITKANIPKGDIRIYLDFYRNPGNVSDNLEEYDVTDSDNDNEFDGNDKIKNDIYEKIKNCKGISYDEQTEILNGIIEFMEKIIVDKCEFEKIHPIYLMPFLFLASIELPRNERPTTRSSSKNKCVKYAQLCITQLLDYITNPNNEDFYGDETLFKTQIEFLMHALTDKKVNGSQKPYTKVLSCRDDGCDKYLKFLTKHSDTDVVESICGSFSERLNNLINEFFYTLTEEEKSNLIENISPYQLVLQHSIVSSDFDKFIFGSYHMPVNETLNIIVYDKLTHFVSMINTILHERNIIKGFNFFYSRTCWLLSQAIHDYSENQKECIRKLIFDFKQPVELADIVYTDPLKGFLKWQTEKIKEPIKEEKPSLWVN